jgi:hypothetical protein
MVVRRWPKRIGGDWGAVTLGSFTTGENGITADPKNVLFQHEYGHYLQSQSSGNAYLTRFGIPSILSKYPHNHHPVEQDANIRAFNYFKEYEEGFEDTDWDASYNPIVGYSLSNPADVTKLLSLNNGIVQPTFWDYLSSVTLFGDVISGLVNSSKDKQKY